MLNPELDVALQKAQTSMSVCDRPDLLPAELKNLLPINEEAFDKNLIGLVSLLVQLETEKIPSFSGSRITRQMNFIRNAARRGGYIQAELLVKIYCEIDGTPALTTKYDLCAHMLGILSELTLYGEASIRQLNLSVAATNRLKQLQIYTLENLEEAMQTGAVSKAENLGPVVMQEIAAALSEFHDLTRGIVADQK